MQLPGSFGSFSVVNVMIADPAPCPHPIAVDIRGPNDTQPRIAYSRGTNAVEAVNRPAGDIMPPSCSPRHACVLLRWMVSGYNMRKRVSRIDSPDLGSYDVVTLTRVSFS